MESFENLEKLLSEIERLRKAYELLSKVHIEVGPYGNGEVSQETRWSMNNFFGFDDSE